MPYKHPSASVLGKDGFEFQAINLGAIAGQITQQSSIHEFHVRALSPNVGPLRAPETTNT
jgi:hypothetical protein